MSAPCTCTPISGSSTTPFSKLTDGIQEVSAILPLLGTEQCEKHVGSTLEGGYLYAAAAPLSIFGSLGIVKAGVAVLFASISIPKLSFTSLRKLSFTPSRQRWLGARVLDNAGFKLVGSVAPVIGMDEKCNTRYLAETRLLQLLEEKHMDNPEDLSVEWRSTMWNLYLILSTMVVAAIGLIPYIHLISRDLRDVTVGFPWLFPILRTAGGCMVATCCQFLMQIRTISLMKNRIIFMAMDRLLVDDLKGKKLDKPELELKRQKYFLWDERLPAEECLWSLQRYLNVQPGTSQIDPPSSTDMQNPSVPPSPSSQPDVSMQRKKLVDLRTRHFPNPLRDRIFILISWIFLLVSLPATVAGYVGSFTLVSNSNQNGPLIWLGLEAALSVIRILLWASNPRFDEKTDVTVRLILTKDSPLVNTEKDIDVVKSSGNVMDLVPERMFLEWITPYTGPLGRFETFENIALYFTLSGDRKNRQKHLFMTVFDLDKRIAVTLHQETDLMYFDALVTCNSISSEMQATVQSEIGKDHPWRTNHTILFDAIADYYRSLTRALGQSPPQSPRHDSPSPKPLMGLLQKLPCCSRAVLPDLETGAEHEPNNTPTALLQWNWSITSKPATSETPNQSEPITLPTLTQHDQLYLQRGYEHHLKTKLVDNWGKWITDGMEAIRVNARNNCHYALANPGSKAAKWELTELDTQLVWEWTRRELILIKSSIALEDILQQRMKECIQDIANKPENERLKQWLHSECLIGRRKRGESEKELAKTRMAEARNAAAKRAGWEERPWKEDGRFDNVEAKWQAAQKFINDKWTVAIGNGVSALEKASSDLEKLVDSHKLYQGDDEERHRLEVVEQLKPGFEHWNSQRIKEQREMDASVQQIHVADSEYLDQAYKYPESYRLAPLVHSRFARLFYSPEVQAFAAKLSFATVYDVRGCDANVLHDVTQNSSTRSIINVRQDLIQGIPENDHILYIGSHRTEVDLPFIKQNRNRWWEQQTSNSSTFYFSPDGISIRDVGSRSGTIAHILIFLQTPTPLRLRLSHRRIGNASVSVQQQGTELRLIRSNEISEDLRLQDFDLDQLEPGRHELELVVRGRGIRKWYILRDILVEFLDKPTSAPQENGVDMVGSLVENRGTQAAGDPVPSIAQDTGRDRDGENVATASTGNENDTLT